MAPHDKKAPRESICSANALRLTPSSTSVHRLPLSPTADWDGLMRTEESEAGVRSPYIG